MAAIGGKGAHLVEELSRLFLQTRQQSENEGFCCRPQSVLEWKVVLLVQVEKLRLSRGKRQNLNSPIVEDDKNGPLPTLRRTGRKEIVLRTRSADPSEVLRAASWGEGVVVSAQAKESVHIERARTLMVLRM